MIKIGPAGTDGLGYIKAIPKAAALGFGILECPFTHGVNVSNEMAKEIGAVRAAAKIDLSIHAPYFINLVSEEKAKIIASKKRILDTCERAHHMGAKYVVFHAGFYGKMDHKKVYSGIAAEIKDMMNTIKKNKWSVELAPETTGKGSQFGDLAELLALVKDTGCHLTVDFAHLIARYNGREEHGKILDELKKNKIKHIHAHFSGIEFTPKGERRHIPLTKEFFMPLATELVKRKTDISIICEAPDPFADAMMMKQIIEGLQK